MIQIQNKSDCCGCHACAQVCPRQCITMKPDAEGFLYPEIDTASCIRCGWCERVCPILNSQPEPKVKKPIAYAAINKDDAIRANSSSGGVFTLLAEYILNQKGVVFGVAMAEDQHSAYHIAVETNDGVDALRGSKYLQSAIGDTYQQAKQALRAGRKVLFTGTPCQIEGLKSFLQGEEYPDLYCMDLICHGVPSPLVWKTYISQMELRMGAPVRRTFFRNKKYGWKKYALLLEFANNKAYECIFSKDAFIQAFLQNACLRPSCHNCRFKKINRVSDITVADYWGIQNQYPEMDDDKGTSLVLVHSAKGKELFEAVMHQMKVKEVPLDRAIKENPSMVSSAKPHKSRNLFWGNLDVLTFNELVRRYAAAPFPWKRCAVKILKIIGSEELSRKIYKRIRNRK